ncbi:VWA domain-containing protein [Neobacillus notoginsengisoli]|uniref:VWA domain-containing protein n=1 Tax=Neobacillus notoginsengisoli TaxID=1578198 RepID=A0A417YS71_9BACI|nr:VWA domain-containing protein [Neobacillus notoginsengisoli]RHW38148.1 VWA domain-containing protein [Neobacillus notoginsengisoli]
MNKGKFLIVSLIAAVVFFGIVYGGISLTSNLGKSKKQITAENAEAQLDKMYSKIDVAKGKPVKGQIDLNPADLAEELPDIDKFPVTVKNSTDSFVEIFSSPEKSGKGNDAWINEVAEDFNDSKLKVDGKAVSVKIRSIASGTATDYIKSGKYIPEAFTPSNEFWGEMVKESGVTTELISKRLAGNVPGIVIKKKKHEQLVDKYGSVNVKAITDAMANNELAMGYTDPFASSTGLNFLLTALNTFDKSNLLGEKAVQGFETFQANVPFTASTTLQMREAAKSGALEGFVLEYQTFINSPDLKDSYVFTPFGVRHDSPLYAIGDISAEKKQIIEKFAEFAQGKKHQELAKKYGFNGLDQYASEMKTVDGATLSAAQKLWKEKKNGNKPIMAVFVADVSGSMDGEPMNRMKESLLKGQKYLGKDNSIGLVTYSDDVTINLPIAPFDTNQQSLFVGAVEGLQANGGTATYDGIVVAIKMLKDEMKKNPDVRPLIFVLSDGETNQGHSLDDIRGLIQAYKVPIYTIGYNANLKALQTISSINEAASINADSDDVVYKIKNLFNVQM